MARPRDEEEFAAAFDDLVAREWPDQAPGSGQRRPDPQQAELFDWVDPNPEPTTEPEYTLDHVEPDDEPTDDDWRPDPRTAGSRLSGLSTMSAIGMGMLVLALASVVAGIALPAMRPIFGIFALVNFVGGLGILFSRLPKSRPPDAGDGAVV